MHNLQIGRSISLLVTPSRSEGPAALESLSGSSASGVHLGRGRCVPLLGRDLPNFRRQPSGNEVSLFGGNDAHSLPFRNAARCLIGNRLGRSEDGELQNVKPIVGNCVASFTHQPLPLPRQAEPEPAIVIFRSHQADAADDAGGFDPTYPRLDCGKSDVATIRQRAVGWIGPRHTTGQKLHQLPVGKNNLNLFGVGEFEWTQPTTVLFRARISLGKSCRFARSLDRDATAAAHLKFRRFREIKLFHLHRGHDHIERLLAAGAHRNAHRFHIR